MSGKPSDPRVVVAPGYSWGHPMLARIGVSTGVLWSRTLAGETAAFLADDYDLTLEEVEAALAFERWCRRRGRYDAPYAERLASDPVKAKRAGGWPRQVWPRASAGDAGAEREGTA